VDFERGGVDIKNRTTERESEGGETVPERETRTESDRARERVCVSVCVKEEERERERPAGRCRCRRSWSGWGPTALRPRADPGETPDLGFTV